jgi:hypothetical protein
MPHDGSRFLSRLVLVLVLLCIALASRQFGTPAHALAKTPDQQDALQIFTRDVFVIVGSSLRNPDDTTPADAPLFNNVGVTLGLTWGAWQAASGTATALSFGNDVHGHTDVAIQLSGLVPGGLYSLFWGTLSPDTNNPLCPGVERTLALISRDPHQQPDASSFVADATGHASFSGRIAGHPLDAVQFFYTVVYHAYGKTYGLLPNAGEFLTQGSTCRSSFGEDSMRQLVIFQTLR